MAVCSVVYEARVVENETVEAEDEGEADIESEDEGEAVSEVEEDEAEDMPYSVEIDESVELPTAHLDTRVD